MNTTQPTDTQLKQTLAKMLPEYCRWSENYLALIEIKEPHLRVLDTELLHLCWLVEETFNDKEIDSYLFRLDDIVEQPPFRNRISAFRYHATWQQRVIALAKVKGIEIL